MKTCAVLVAILLAVFLCCPVAGAATFTEDFNGPTVSHLLKLNVPLGYSFTISGGQGIFGGTNGAVGDLTLSTNFQLLGDFTITARASNCSQAYNSNIGVIIWYPGTGICATTSIYRGYNISSTIVYGQIWGGSPFDGIGSIPTDWTSNIPGPVVMKVQRTGNTLAFSYDFNDSGSFTPLWSASGESLTGTVGALIYIYNGASANFDYFSLSAAGFRFPNAVIPSALPLLLLMD
jgi:hypothetical protein